MVGWMVTVWDGEIAGIEGALKTVGSCPILIISDSRVAIQAMKRLERRAWQGQESL